jgi:cytochrome P450
MVNMTTRNAILNALHRLASDPELRLRLHADRSQVNEFIQEVLRVDTPLQRSPKRATKSTYLDGTYIPKDSTLLLLLGAANMSAETCRDDPGKFCPFAQSSGAKREKHIAFGPGARYCLGQHLVVMEMEAIVNYVLDNASQLRVIGESERVHNVDVGNFGWSVLNLAF